MRRSIITLALAASLAGGCYGELEYPDLVYAGSTTAGDPMYYGDGHYWVTSHGSWYWWNSYDHSWKYEPYGYYSSYYNGYYGWPYYYYPYSYGFYYGPYHGYHSHGYYARGHYGHTHYTGPPGMYPSGGHHHHH